MTVQKEKKTRKTKTRSEVARSARAKGKRGERKLARLLQDAFGVEMHRTPGSGALRWGDPGLAEKTRGDLVCADPRFPFVIEEKNRESWTFLNVLDGSGPINAWFHQCSTDATAVKKLPLLVVKKNYVPYQVILKREDFRKFSAKTPFPITYMKYRDFGVMVCLNLKSFIRCVQETILPGDK